MTFTFRVNRAKLWETFLFLQGFSPHPVSRAHFLASGAWCLFSHSPQFSLSGRYPCRLPGWMRGNYSARWGKSQDLGANYYIPAQLAYLSLFLTESLLSGTQPLQFLGCFGFLQPRWLLLMAFLCCQLRTWLPLVCKVRY